MMKRARDVRDQLAGLMDRVEIEMIKSEDDVAIRKGHWVFDFSANFYVKKNGFPIQSRQYVAIFFTG